MVESTKLVIGKPDMADDSEIVKEEESKIDKVKYTCKKCRTFLFDEDAIQTHTSKVKKFTGIKSVSHHTFVDVHSDFV